MRISKSIFIFTLINLISAIIFICFLPSKVIFGLTGNLHASEFIGRWNNLIIPIVQVACSLTILLIDVFNPREHKYRYLTAWVAISFTTYLMWVLMFLQYDNSTLGEALNWPWTIVLLFPIALFFLAEGYYIRNKEMDDFSIFGLKWVRESSLVWRKTHDTAGITLIITAFSMLILAVLNEIFWHTWWIYLVVFLIWFVVHYLYTMACADRYAKRFGTK